jgi:hypothetical protein
MLDNFKSLIDKLTAFDFGQEMTNIVEDNEEKIADLQREQMLEGRGVDGDYIRPFYSENPYFKRPGAALRYAQWKQKITPNPKRPLDVPNLFITGVFHDSLFVEVNAPVFEVKTDVSFGKDVFSVHQNAQGLDEDSRMQFAEEVTLPSIKASLLEKTGLVITEK